MQEGLNDWQWWNLVEGDDKKEKEVWPFLYRVKDETELLVYAQRAFIKARFESYDPARQDMWEQHDRPWDYDHILPSAWVSYQRVYSPAARRRGLAGCSGSRNSSYASDARRPSPISRSS